MAFEALGDGGGLVLIGEQELDGSEAGLGGGGEAVEKRPLVEHHGEIGSKAGHVVRS